MADSNAGITSSQYDSQDQFEDAHEELNNNDSRASADLNSQKWPFTSVPRVAPDFMFTPQVEMIIHNITAFTIMTLALVVLVFTAVLVICWIVLWKACAKLLLFIADFLKQCMDDTEFNLMKLKAHLRQERRYADFHKNLQARSEIDPLEKWFLSSVNSSTSYNDAEERSTHFYSIKDEEKDMSAEPQHQHEEFEPSETFIDPVLEAYVDEEVRRLEDVRRRYTRKVPLSNSVPQPKVSTTSDPSIEAPSSPGPTLSTKENEPATSPGNDTLRTEESKQATSPIEQWRASTTGEVPPPEQTPVSHPTTKRATAFKQRKAAAQTDFVNQMRSVSELSSPEVDAAPQSFDNAQARRARGNARLPRSQRSRGASQPVLSALPRGNKGHPIAGGWIQPVRSALVATAGSTTSLPATQLDPDYVPPHMRMIRESAAKDTAAASAPAETPDHLTGSPELKATEFPTLAASPRVIKPEDTEWPPLPSKH